MRSKQIILILALGGLGLSVSGCAAALVGAGAAGVAYVRGDLQATMDKNITEVYDASLKAVDELELSVISKQKSALDAKIVTRSSQDKKIHIMLKRTEANATDLSIRIGAFGDETQSRAIYDQINKNL
jgi:hypothetical protein